MAQSTSVQGFRLSPQQRRLWLLQSRDSAAAHRAECAVEIEGELDVRLIERALAELVERHEILRSTFPRPTGAKYPAQVIGAADFELSREEPGESASSPTPGTPGSSADLERGPILHAHLLEHGEGRHTLRLTLPTLAADVTALTVIVRELSQLYTALSGGASSEALDEPIQYADLAEWQDEILEGEDAEPGREFWRAAGDLDAFSVQLPFERRRAGAAGFEPSAQPLPLPAETTAKLRRLAESSGEPLSVVLLAAFFGYFQRLTGQPSLAIATSFGGRSYDGLEEAVGPLERFLPLSHRFEDTRDFAQLLEGIAEKIEAFYEWQEYFSWESVGAEDDFSLPLAFRFDELPAPWRAGELELSFLEARASSDRFALCLSCSEVGGELRVEIVYDPEVLDAQDARRTGESFRNLLDALDEKTRLDELEILGTAERRQLLTEFNSAERGPVDPGVLFLDLFARRAAELPEKVAVRCGSNELSFAELERRSNRLAHHLLAAGVGSDDLVAIYLDRSLEIVIGKLAILKSGAAYLPLDPEYPRERLAHILENSGAERIVTRSELAAELPEALAERIDLDAERDEIDARPEHRPAVAVRPENLAYVKYTSGSTGDPKGVMVTRGNVGHCIQALAERLGVDAETLYLHTASFAFSSSTRHLLFPLSTGATVVVARGEERTDPTVFLRTADAQRVAVLDTVPSMWRGSTHSLERLPPRALRLGLSTGEALMAGVPAAWYEHLGNLQFFNLYGVTETATTITAHPVPRGGESAEREDGEEIVAIGRPIADTQVYPLDRHGRLVPIGAVGELHVGGGSPGRGYFRRPALSAERFVPDPFSGRAGDRLFKTGDLGSFRGDGTLEFHGRIDHQIQIRGFRIEPGEIEAALGQHASVDQCAVVVRPGGPSGASLVAFFVPAHEKVPEIPRLRAHLRELLPAYMVPNELIAVPELPLTAHGKVDYKRLAEPPKERGSTEPYVAPRSPLEEKLAAIWAEALDLERVGVEDDFIELGGHSMTAIFVVSKVREDLGVELPVVRLFEIRTVAELAELVEELRLSQASDDDLADVLEELDSLSDEEVAEQLSKDGA